MLAALAPLNPTVGDLAGNARLIDAAIDEAAGAGADLLVLPELCLAGYPPMDLLHHEGFVDAAERTLRDIVAGTSRAPGLTVVIGAPLRRKGRDLAAGVANGLVAARAGREIARSEKQLLPTYDVFDERRHFTPGDGPVVLEVAGERVGLSVCEDLWRGADAASLSRYERQPDPMTQLVSMGARVIVNASASPFVLHKHALQQRILADHASKHGVTILAVNQHGANDGLVFNGFAECYTPAGCTACGEMFTGTLTVIDTASTTPVRPAPEDDCAALFRALRLGVRDYFRKTGARTAVLGLSGGIDSALVACLAAAALGGNNLLGVSMPSRYSSEGSKTDAADLARALGARFLTAPIAGMHDASEAALTRVFEEIAPGAQAGLAEENIQARLRGLTLMAVSNKTPRSLVLSTGNKSELAAGYSTLYGDMCGAIMPIADLTKRRVYALSRWINAHHAECGFASPPIPEATLTKPPSAELRPDQRDEDTLGPYDILDEVVELYVEERLSPAQIREQTGIASADIARIVRMIDVNEYKRRQAPIVLKVTKKAFGVGRRYPVVQGWRHESPES